MAAKNKILKSSLNKYDEYNLFGLVCSTNDYRLAWLINNKLNIVLKKTEDLNISDEKVDELAVYSRYIFKTNSTKFELLSNKDANSRKLLKQNFDFFLRYLGDDENIRSTINSIKEVLIIDDLKANTKISEKVLQKLNTYFDCVI